MYVAVIAAYTLLLILLAQSSEGAELESLGFLRALSWGGATVLAIAAFVWRQQIPDLEFTRRGRRGDTSAFVRLRVACLVTWSLCGVIAILGLMVGFLTYRAAEYLPLILLAVVLLYLHRPAAWPIERIIAEAEPR